MKTEGAREFEVFPREDGSVVLSSFRDDYAVDVTVFEDGKFDVEVERNDQLLDEALGVSLDEVLERVKCLNWRNRSSYAFSTQGTIRANEGVSIAPRYSRQTTAFPSSTWNVRKNAAPKSAIT